MISNRWVRGGLALAIGFTFTTAVIHIADNSSSPTESAGERLGPLSMREYCRKAYGPRSTAVHLQTGAWGWRCWSQRNQLLDPSEIDPDEACETMFGSPAYARIPDPTSAYGWVCFRGPTTS